jgi:hypothetical protein
MKRIVNTRHLSFVKRLPCTKCFKAAPSDAAHVRTGNDGGIGIKPSDNCTVPLCRACHSEQHDNGERTFWGKKFGNALDNLMNALYVQSGNQESAHLALLHFNKGEW